MKKIYTIIAALAIATGATAQSFTVHGAQSSRKAPHL